MDCRKAGVTAGGLVKRLLQWELMETCPGEVVMEIENLQLSPTGLAGN